MWSAEKSAAQWRIVDKYRRVDSYTEFISSKNYALNNL